MDYWWRVKETLDWTAFKEGAVNPMPSTVLSLEAFVLTNWTVRKAYLA